MRSRSLRWQRAHFRLLRPACCLCCRLSSARQSSPINERPLALCAGLTLSFASLGALLAVTFAWVGSFTTSLHWLAIGLLLVFGLLSAFPRWGTRFFGKLGLADFARAKPQSGLFGSFLIGTQLGLVWSPCAGPILAGILTLAAVDHNAAGSFGLLLCYGTGASIPMIALAYGGRRVAALTTSLQRHAERLQRIGGVLIACSAIAIVLG